MARARSKVFFSTLVDLNLAEAGVTHAVELTEELAKRGRDVTVFAFGNRAIAGVRVHELKSFKKYSRLSHYLTGCFDSFVSMLREARRNGKPDLIHERHSFYDAGFWAAKTLGVPIVLEANGLFVEEHKQKNYFKGALRAPLFALMEFADVAIVRSADAVVAVTPEIKDYYVKRGVPASKIVVAPNGVNASKIKPLDKAKARKALGYGARDKIVAYAGSFRAGEGVETLIAAFPAILERVPSAKLLVMGDSKGSGGVTFHPTLEEAREQARALGLRVGERERDSVRFTGRVPHEKLANYLAAADACAYPIAPSKQGASHLKVFEYLACGKPVIATRMPGLTFIEEKKCGRNFDFDAGDSGASGNGANSNGANGENTINNLAAAVVKTLQSETALREASAAARRVAVRDLSWSKTADAVLEAHEIALKGSRK